MKKRILLPLAVCLALLLCLAVPAMAAVDLNDPQFVTDDAGVLSPEMEAKITEANEALYYDCSGAEFAVVTVRYPPSGLDREEFAKKIFDSWKLGSQEEDNGVLLVLYTEADDFWLECGRGVFDSPYVDEIADMVGDDSDFWKAIRKDQDEKAVSLLLDGLTGWFHSYYATPSSGGSSSSGSSASHASGGSSSSGSSASHASGGSSSSSSPLTAILFLLLIILLIVVLTSPFRVRRRWGHWGVWPFYYASSWWPTRVRVNRRPGRPRPATYHRVDTAPYVSHSWSRPRPSARPPYGSRPSSFSGRPSSSWSKPSSGSKPSSSWSKPSSGSRPSSGGFGGHSGGSSGRTGGFSGRPGGGGHSGGGFGHR